jgi:hypothetical protein
MKAATGTYKSAKQMKIERRKSLLKALKAFEKVLNQEGDALLHEESLTPYIREMLQSVQGRLSTLKRELDFELRSLQGSNNIVPPP